MGIPQDPAVPGTQKQLDFALSELHLSVTGDLRFREDKCFAQGYAIMKLLQIWIPHPPESHS